MKHLLLMRHAKSSQDLDGITDFERPLNERGLKDAPEMGKRILKSKFKPDLIVSSNARRALDTAKLVAKQIKIDAAEIQRETDLYEAGLSDILHIIRHLDDSKSQIILIGHNPSFTGMVGYLSNSFIEHLPTSGIALIEFPVLSWKQITQGAGTMTWHDFPKNHLSRIQ
ncbi:MAG: histidine phosphatase family protein [Bacteroidia bacterium]|jgi:phosphohistidine phosphatase